MEVLRTCECLYVHLISFVIIAFLMCTTIKQIVQNRDTVNTERPHELLGI